MRRIASAIMIMRAVFGRATCTAFVPAATRCDLLCFQGNFESSRLRLISGNGATFSRQRRRFGTDIPSHSKELQRAEQSSMDKRETKLYVGNISFDTTKRNLEHHFAKYGNIVDVRLPKDRNDAEKHRGFAFVSFVDLSKDDIYAIVHSDKILDGRSLLLSWDFDRGQRVPKRFDQKADEEMRTLFTIDGSVCPATDETVLRSIVVKHCDSLDTYLEKQPIAAHTSAAFEVVKRYARDFFPDGVPTTTGTPNESHSGPAIILDSGCGTGRSTRMLSKQCPTDLIIGVDRSLSRLSKNMVGERDEDEDSFVRTIEGQHNALLVRAELASFWRLLLNENWHVRQHYLLYPNPYPKPRRLKSRFYAHPIFPILLSIGDKIIVRSNWNQYLSEFATSAMYVTGRSAKCSDSIDIQGPDRFTIPDEDSALTNFERKYHECGESIYEIRIHVTEAKDT